METLQSDGMMFNVVSSEKEAFEFALEQFAGDARASVGVDRITFEHTDLIRKQISIVYYPLMGCQVHFCKPYLSGSCRW